MPTPHEPRRAQHGLAGLALQTSPPSGRRRYAYRCLYGSARRHHVAGQLADEMYRHFARAGCLRCVDGRAVGVTPMGRRELLPRLTIK